MLKQHRKYLSCMYYIYYYMLCDIITIITVRMTMSYNDDITNACWFTAKWKTNPRILHINGWSPTWRSDGCVPHTHSQCTQYNTMEYTGTQEYRSGFELQDVLSSNFLKILDRDERNYTSDQRGDQRDDNDCMSRVGHSSQLASHTNKSKSYQLTRVRWFHGNITVKPLRWQRFHLDWVNMRS